MRKLWFLPLGLVAVLAVLWLARAQVAGELAQSYFRQHGIASTVSFGRLGLSGISGRIALGPEGNPDFSAEAVEVDFDPLSFKPRIVEVRLVRPLVRAQVTADGKLVLPSLQTWLDSLSSGEASSEYVSENLTVALSNLRALLTTPAGPVELGGDVLLRRGHLVSTTLRLRPAVLSYQGTAIRIAAADLRLFPSRGDYGMTLRFNGAVQRPGFQAEGMTAQLSAGALHWDAQGKSLTTPRMQLRLTAASVNGGGLSAVQPVAELVAENVKALADGTASARLRLRGGADLAPLALAKMFPVLARDSRLTGALQANLQRLDLTGDADLAWQKGALNFALTKPLDIRGGKGGVLNIARLAVTGAPAALQGYFDFHLKGAGLPSLSASAREFHWRDGVFTSDAALKASFDFAMLRGANIAASGTASFADSLFTFQLGACAPDTLAAFHPGDSDLARALKGAICPAPGEPTFTADAAGWTFAALAKDTSMTVPLGDVQFEKGAGHIGFSGQGDVITGKVRVTAATMRDHAPVPRFAPMNGTGDITLADWVWRGDFAASDSGGIKLGTASFRHVMATGSGQMTINAPDLDFAEGKLQPAMISPLLGAVARAQGKAKFEGALTWTKAGLAASHGTLELDALDFLTPLGTAHAIDAKIVLSSLLPPVTAPGQHIAISKIDWTLPLSGIGMDFSFGDGTLKLDNFTTNIADGNVRLGNIAVALNGPRNIKGAADLKSISLAPLVAASNLGGKIKLEGKVTGNVPFTYGPDGFRITNGHLAADGPGRISLDRSVWNQDDVAVNAVQDLAYQAMENLAYEQLSADINSIPGGRLQVVFHIKGRSDPPKPQQAEIKLQDIVNGSALQKPIDLPSGTPIDLTLDTSLNFDELLKSYSEAWSKTLGGP